MYELQLKSIGSLLKHVLFVFELKDLLVVDDSQMTFEIASFVVCVFPFMCELQPEFFCTKWTLHLPDVLVNFNELNVWQIVLS